MKIVFYGGIPGKGKVHFGEDAGTQFTYSYFLRNIFEDMGIETDYFGISVLMNAPERIPDGDHLISVAQRGVTNAMRKKGIINAMDKIRDRICGKVTSICDHAKNDNPVEDITFYAVPCANEPPKHKYVGWAADPTILYPQKDPSVYRILIDHSLYHDGIDTSREIIIQCLEFAKHSDKPVLIRRFVSGGCVDVLSVDDKIPVYDRKGLPYPDACMEYNKADIFIPTHAESMGLSVIECAMAGARICSKSGYIRKELLSDLDSVVYDDDIPFSILTRNINFEKSRSLALKYNWDSVAGKILKALNEN